MGLFDLFTRQVKQEKKDEDEVVSELTFNYRSIPQKADRELEIQTYPQVPLPIPCLTVSQIRNRYAEQLHAVLDVLPVTGQEVDAYVMPAIFRTFRTVHLLPASERHHHPGCGGLLCHSLECAALMINQAENSLIGRSGTQQDVFRNRGRWLVACALLGLVHDVGKIFDVKVVNDDGLRWNSAAEGLMSWIERNQVRRYFVSYRPERIHKDHELRSVRLAYQRILPEATLSWLAEISEGAIFDAMDRAIIGADSCLTTLLRKAEAASIHGDAEKRRTLTVNQAYVSSSFEMVIVQAIRDCIVKGRWQVNTSDGCVFVAKEGVFIAMTEQVGADICQTASDAGAGFIPRGIRAIVDVLIEGHVSKTFVDEKGQSSAAWPITALGQRHNCFCISNVALLATDIGEHVPIDIVFGQEDAQIQGPEQKARCKDIAVNLKAPTTPFEIKKSRSQLSAATGYLTQEELQRTVSAPLSTRQIEDLVDRIVHQVAFEIRQGKGELVSDVRQDKDGIVSASMQKLENLLERNKIDLITLKAVLALRDRGPILSINEKHRVFVVHERKLNENKS